MKHAAPRKPKKYDAAVAVVCAFCVSVALFGLAVLAALWRQYEPDIGQSEEVSGMRGVQRDAWVVLHDDDRLVGLWHVTADTARMAVDVVVYPPEAEVVDGITVTTAAAVFGQYGERVTAFFSQDETLMMPLSGVAMLVREVSGNLSVTLPGVVGHLPSGAVMLTPLQVTEVLRFNEFEGGCVERAAVEAAVAKEFFLRAFARMQDAERAFECLTEASESRLSVAQFAAVRDEWEALAAAETVCTARVVAGYTTGTSTRYVVTE